MNNLLEIDMRQMHEAVRKLERVKQRAIPHAARDTLNQLAFDGRKLWQRKMGKAMTLRSPYTARSVAVDKARGIDMRVMESRLGSLQPYMATQEEGGSVASHGKHGVTIPTPTASGEGLRASPRKRLVRRANWLSAIKLPPSGRQGVGRKQRNAIALSAAKRSGAKVAFLDLGTRKGIVRIMGRGRSAQVRMLWDMSKRAVRIKSNPTLEPTMEAMQRRAPRIAQRHAIIQIRRALR